MIAFWVVLGPFWAIIWRTFGIQVRALRPDSSIQQDRAKYEGHITLRAHRGLVARHGRMRSRPSGDCRDVQGAYNSGPCSWHFGVRLAAVLGVSEVQARILGIRASFHSDVVVWVPRILAKPTGSWRRAVCR